MIPSPDGMNEEQLQEAERISALIVAYIQGTLSPAGHDELDHWVNTDPKNMLLFEELTDERQRDEAIQWMKDLDTKKALSELKKKIKFHEKPVPAWRTWPYMVAAVLLLVLTIWGIRKFILNNINGEGPAPIVKAQSVKPGGYRATLAFDDGRILDITGMDTGIVHNEKGMVINKTKQGELLYNPGHVNVELETAYNTLTTPRGGEYMLTLADSSKVWLNAESSIRFPVTFSKKAGTRKVYITGEVYFEIRKDPVRPFIVEFSRSGTVRVLGTHFSITDYPDDDATKVTLAEGLVNVNETTLLRPGQQFRTDRSTGQTGVTAQVDVNEELAWKNGFFTFNNSSIQTIMRELSRWYDIEVEYSDKTVKANFTATVSRHDDISTILTRLQKTGAIHFKMEGKKITVITD